MRERVRERGDRERRRRESEKEVRERERGDREGRRREIEKEEGGERKTYRFQEASNVSS